MDYDRDKSKANAGRPTAEVIADLETRPELMARAEIVGRWIWIAFDARPDEETRRFLHETGFYWNKKRSVWQHSCGVESTRSPGNPRWKYGSVPLAAALDEAKAVA